VIKSFNVENVYAVIRRSMSNRRGSRCSGCVAGGVETVIYIDLSL